MSERYLMNQVSVRLVKDPPLYTSEPIDSPEKAASFISTLLNGYDREVFGVVNLRSDGRPINFSIISIGTLENSLVHPRELLKSSILSSASSVLLFHNHPSGVLQPSRDDTQVTKRLQEICALVGIPVRDHIIVGNDKTYFSFLEKGELEVPQLYIPDDLDEIDLANAMVADGAVRIYSASSVEPAEDSQIVEAAQEKPSSGEKVFNWQEAKERREQQLTEITDQLEKGIQELFDSESYKKYLDCLSKFHHYSLNNTLLIAMQRPDTSGYVASFSTWKRLGRHVKKGEKGIRILAPAPYKAKVERQKLDPHTGTPIFDASGQPVMETVSVERAAFKVAYVFDKDQTEGKEIERPGVTELIGEVDGYNMFLSALIQACPVPVSFEDIPSGAKGYYHLTEDRIVVQQGMSELQTIKTLIHEMSHQMNDSLAIPEAERKDQRTREVIAESVAYTCLKHWNLDSDDYSLMYIGEWSSGKDLPELKASLQTIRDTANELISEVESRVHMMTQQKDMAKTVSEELAKIKEEQSVPEIAEQEKGMSR